MFLYNYFTKTLESVSINYADYLLSREDATILARFPGDVPIYRVTVTDNSSKQTAVLCVNQSMLMKFVRDCNVTVPISHKVSIGNEGFINKFPTMREAFKAIQ